MDISKTADPYLQWSIKQKIEAVRKAAIEAENRHGKPVLLKHIFEVWGEEHTAILRLDLIMRALNLQAAPRHTQNRPTTNNNPNTKGETKT